MHHPKIHVITGGIGCGKSTICRELKLRKMHVIDCDAIVGLLYKPGQKGAIAIQEHFGDDYLTTEGAVDNKKLAQTVFSDASLRQELEEIIHPLVREELERKTKRLARWRGARHVFWEVPLFFETLDTPLFSDFDFASIVVVAADRDTVMRRLVARNGYTLEEAGRRIDAQMPLSDKKSYPGVIIINNEDDIDPAASVATLLTQLDSPPFTHRAFRIIALAVCGFVLGRGIRAMLRRV